MRTIILFALIIACFLSLNTNAQCPVFEVTLESQADVDAFANDFPNCTEINGNLRIGTTLAGSPTNITDISGLSNLTTLNSNLIIWRNPNLSSLNGLQNITSIGASININDNNSLTSFDGLQNVTSIGSNLLIDNNFFLESLDGLQGITEIPGRVYLSNNIRLTDISAMGNITNIGGELDIRINTMLESLNGLGALLSIGEDFILLDNHLLIDINALDHTMSILGELEIRNNTELSTCDVTSICEYLEISNTAIISNNKDDCNSLNTLLTNCESVSTLETENLNIEIFPNPTSKDFFIKNKNQLKIKEIIIFDVYGKEHLRIQNDFQVINVSSLVNGLFFVKLLLEEGELVKKLKIQN